MPGYSIQLQVSGDVEGSWQLTWQDPQWPERHYHIDAAVLEDSARDARKALQDVVDDARNKLRLGASLKKLAKAGSNLQKAIFLTHGKSIVDAAYIRDVHLPSRTDWTLLISVNQGVYIPWGLAYDGNPDALPDDPAVITPAMYAGFWALKYRVCTLHEIIDPSGVRKPRANDEVQMLTIVNRPIWDTAVKNIPPTEVTMFNGTLARSEPLIASSDEFFKTFKKLYRGIDLLYVYCHANGTKLALGGDDDISVTKFQMNLYYDDREPHPPCLVFLNGCQTAIGAEKGGFMKATGGPGFCGFIGTEAKVPDLFALRFAARFFFLLLYGELTVSEIMDQLRNEHFPLGLVYSTCCHPLFKIKRITPAPALPAPVNLSTETLQAGTLL